MDNIIELKPQEGDWAKEYVEEGFSLLKEHLSSEEHEALVRRSAIVVQAHGRDMIDLFIESLYNLPTDFTFNDIEEMIGRLKEWREKL